MKRKFCCLLLVLLSFTTSSARADSGAQATATSREALDKMAANVRVATLPNGLRVIMYPRPVAPVFAGTVTVRVGGTDEPEGKTGIAHLLEHMAFKGTKTLGTKDYEKERPLLEELEKFEVALAKGEKLSEAEEKRRGEVYSDLEKLWVIGEFADQFNLQGGTGMNATTDAELTRYFVELPRNAFEFWCAIEADRLLNPVMRQFYKEREVVLEERRMRVDDEPSGKLYELLLGAAFRQHRYRNPVIGYSNDVNRLTATAVEEFREQFYVPSNIVVSIAGDISPDRDLPTVERYFGRLPPGPKVKRPSTIEPQQEGEKRVTLKADASPVVYIAYHKPNYPHADDAPISLLSEVLAGGRLSPLYTSLVKKKKVAAQISTEEAPGIAYPNLLMFGIVPRAPHTAEEVVRAFDEELDLLLRTGFQQEDLEIAKRAYAMSYLGQLRSNTGIALNLASSELFFGTWRASITWFDEAMRVTTMDLLRVGREYLTRSNRTIAQIEPRK